MNIQRTLFAAVVLALMFGCTWAATEASDTAGFAVIPDNEAGQIIGGDGVGYECLLGYPRFYLPCEDETQQSQCSTAYAFNAMYYCAYTGSGECYDMPTIVGWWADCEWTDKCQQSGGWQPFWGTDCTW